MNSFDPGWPVLANDIVKLLFRFFVQIVEDASTNFAETVDGILDNCGDSEQKNMPEIGNNTALELVYVV
jgi:hypothetical protein